MAEGISACAEAGKQKQRMANPSGVALACFEACLDAFSLRNLEAPQGFCLEKRSREGRFISCSAELLLVGWQLTQYRVNLYRWCFKVFAQADG